MLTPLFVSWPQYHHAHGHHASVLAFQREDRLDPRLQQVFAAEPGDPGDPTEGSRGAYAAGHGRSDADGRNRGAGWSDAADVRWRHDAGAAGTTAAT